MLRCFKKAENVTLSDLACLDISTHFFFKLGDACWGRWGLNFLYLIYFIWTNGPLSLKVKKPWVWLQRDISCPQCFFYSTLTTWATINSELSWRACQETILQSKLSTGIKNDWRFLLISCMISVLSMHAIWQLETLLNIWFYNQICWKNLGNKAWSTWCVWGSGNITMYLIQSLESEWNTQAELGNGRQMLPGRFLAV